MKKIKELTDQIRDCEKRLIDSEAKATELAERADTLTYEALMLKSAEAQAELNDIKIKQAKLADHQAELRTALKQAGARLEAAKAEQSAAEREAKMADLKTAADKWLERSSTVNKLIDKLAVEIEQYQEARSEVFAAATSLGGRRIGLERKSTIANYVHLRLSRIYPHDFIWINEHLRRHGGAEGMDKAIAGALVSGTDSASLRMLGDGLQGDLKQRLIEREAMAVS